MVRNSPPRCEVAPRENVHLGVLLRTGGYFAPNGGGLIRPIFAYSRVTGGRKSVIFRGILLEIDIEWIEMPFKRPQCPQPPFWGDFNTFLAGFGGITLAVFRSFWTHKTAKGTQHGIKWDQKRLSTVPSAAGKCWPSAVLVTKLRFASLYHQLFPFLSAGVGWRLSSVGLRQLSACVALASPIQAHWCTV